MRDNSGLNVAVGFILGVAAGVATGMLFAPKSGEELRHEIADKTKRSASKATDVAKNTVSQTKQRIGRAANKTRSAITEGTRAAKEA